MHIKGLCIYSRHFGVAPSSCQEYRQDSVCISLLIGLGGACFRSNGSHCAPSAKGIDGTAKSKKTPLARHLL